MSNPFFAPLTETGIPAFDRIEFEHYREAIERGFAEHDQEIAAIIANPQAPDFANTVEALERSGALLRRVFRVFWNMASTDTSEELQALEREVEPEYAVHQGRITSDPGLFKRIRAVVDGPETLDAEQSQLLQKTYNNFLRAGAELSDKDRARVNAINERLALSTTQFGQNVLRDTNHFELLDHTSGHVDQTLRVWLPQVGSLVRFGSLLPTRHQVARHVCHKSGLCVAGSKIAKSAPRYFPI